MANALNLEAQQSATEKSVFTSGVPSKDPTDSKGFRQQLYQEDDEPGSLTDVEYSIGSCEKVSKPGTSGQAYLMRPTLDDPLKTASSEKPCHTAGNISKVISSKNEVVSSKYSIIPSIRRYNDNPFSDAVSNGNVHSSLSEKTGPIGKFPVPLSSEMARDIENAPCAPSATTGIINLFNNSAFLPATFPEFPLDFPVSKIDDTPIYSTENIKIPDFQQDGEKSANEGTSTPSGFVKPEAPCGLGVIASPSKPWQSNISRFDIPPVSLPKTNSTELPNLSYQAFKTPIRVDMNSNKSLTEILLILENWGRKGLDKTFNLPIVDFKTYFRNDLLYGLDLIKQMDMRMNTLMTAANNLPDAYEQGFDCARTRTRCDLISTAITVWLTINDLKLRVIQALNHMETDPENIITNLYNKMTDNLSLLGKEIEDFQHNIRVFYSEMEKFL